MILVFLLYLLFASTFTLGKAALMYLPPILFIGVRMTLGGFLLLTYLWVRKRNSMRIAFKHYGLFVRIVFFHIYLSYILEFWGMEQISSAKACLMYNMSPFFTALFSYFILAERFSVYQILGLIIGFTGFIPVLIAQIPQESASTFLFFSFHELALISSVAISAYGWIVMKQLTSVNYSFVLINGVGMFGGGLCALITSFFFEGTPALRELTSSMPQIVSFLNPAQNAFFMLCVFSIMLILISNIICYNLYGYLLSHYSPTFLSLSGLMTPLFAALLGWFFLDEIITWHFFATFIIVSLGVYLFYKEKPLKFKEKGL